VCAEVSSDRARFEQLIGIVLIHEGGYVCDPSDPGGETKYGISKRAYPHLDIRNLTLERAKDIYYRDWWRRYRIYQLKDDQIAAKVLDLCVNVGARNGIAVLQRALHAVGYQHVIIDGVIGPQTLGAANRANPEALIAALRAEAACYYRQLVRSNQTLTKFEKGWMRRAYS